MTVKDFPTRRTISNYTETPLIIKLISGEELLITNIKVVRNRAVITNPYCIIRVLGQEKTNYQLDKWMPFTASDYFELDLNNIITYNVPNEELTSFYSHILQADNDHYSEYHHPSHQIH